VAPEENFADGKMKISVITVCRNTALTIEQTIRSVQSQTCSNIEHIIVDGASTDGTVDIIRKQEAGITRWISEPDNGIYDAMNKGIDLATGDIIGFLNADDILADSGVLERIVQVMEDSRYDGCYADVVYVKADMKSVLRRYRSDRFSPDRLAYGWMPAHPTLYLRKEVFERSGKFKTDYEIAADYELVARIFGRCHIKARYIPEVWVKMRAGGVSTRNIRSNWVISREIVRACRENGIKTNLFKVCLKYPRKMLELVAGPS